MLRALNITTFRVDIAVFNNIQLHSNDVKLEIRFSVVILKDMVLALLLILGNGKLEESLTKHENTQMVQRVQLYNGRHK